jgi:hypothetical protein
VRIQDGEEVHMEKGDFWHTPADTPHGVRTGATGAKILDIFSPPRGAYTITLALIGHDLTKLSNYYGAWEEWGSRDDTPIKTRHP